MHLTIKCDNPFILNDIVSYSLQVEGMGKGIEFPTYMKHRGSVAVLLKTMRYRYGSSPAMSQLICRIPSVEIFHTRITIFLTDSGAKSPNRLSLWNNTREQWYPSCKGKDVYGGHTT